MRFIKQFAIILAVSCAGEILHYFIPLPVPASIYGLVLIFVLLCTHILKISDVRETAEFLIEIMPMMFIPLAVSLLDSRDVLGPVLIPVCAIMVISTVLVFAVTGRLSQRLIKKTPEEEKE